MISHIDFLSSLLLGKWIQKTPIATNFRGFALFNYCFLHLEVKLIGVVKKLNTTVLFFTFLFSVFFNQILIVCNNIESIIHQSNIS